jgi:LL-diaminopimelate aminotransferase
VPEGFTSRQFADYVLSAAGVVVTPGSSYGNQGEGYFRMSITVPDNEVDVACKRLFDLNFEPAMAAEGNQGGGQRAPEKLKR